jgi:uncharacterized protein (DUF302 family)
MDKAEEMKSVSIFCSPQNAWDVAESKPMIALSIPARLFVRQELKDNPLTLAN